MKRTPIRNKEKERVLDVIVDKDSDRIMLETKVGRQTRHIDYETLQRQIEEIRTT